MNDMREQSVPMPRTEREPVIPKRGQGNISEKEAAKQALEAEIARVWEKVRVAEEEAGAFTAQIDDLQAKIDAGGATPKVAEARVAALKEYIQYRAEAEKRLDMFSPVLKRLEAQHQTVFGAPFVH